MPDDLANPAAFQDYKAPTVLRKILQWKTMENIEEEQEWELEEGEVVEEEAQKEISPTKSVQLWSVMCSIMAWQWLKLGRESSQIWASSQ